MSALEQFAITAAKRSTCYLVSADGDVHATTWGQYLLMPAGALVGAHGPYVSVESAVRCAARIWQRRERMS